VRKNDAGVFEFIKRNEGVEITNEYYVKLMRIDMKKTVEYAVSKASKMIQQKDADKVIESFVMAIQHTFRQEMERSDRSKTV
jgi:hypothetical protein